MEKILASDLEQTMRLQRDIICLYGLLFARFGAWSFFFDTFCECFRFGGVFACTVPHAAGTCNSFWIK
jgi:hypothetical protein